MIPLPFFENRLLKCINGHGVGKILSFQTDTGVRSIGALSIGGIHKVAGIELHAGKVCGFHHGNAGDGAEKTCIRLQLPMIAQHKVMVIAIAVMKLPAIAPKSVDFPAPFAPMSVTIRPCGMRMLTPCTAWMPP